MSKIFSNTVKKTTLWAVVSAILLAAAIVVCALFGFNKSLVMKDSKTLTVSLNAYVYNTQLEEVKGDLEKKLDADYIMEGAMTGDVSEIVFVFDKDADVAAYKATVESYLADKVANAGGGWTTAKYSVSVSTEKAAAVLAKGYVVRAAIAGAVLAVLAFVYVSLRYQLKSGIIVGVSAILSMLLTAGLVVLTRIYVTTSAAYAITFAGLLTTALTLLSLNNLRAKEQTELNAELVAQSLAVKEVLYTALVLVVGALVVGILGGTAAIWFAVAAILAVLVSVFYALIFAPAMYVSLKAWEKPVKSNYVGAKKAKKEETEATTEE